MTENASESTAVVAQMIDDFKGGRIEAIVGRMAPDVDFCASGHPDLLPWARPRRSPSEVAEYFEEILQYLSYPRFDATDIFERGGTTYVTCNIEVGNADEESAGPDALPLDVVLLFDVSHGKVVRYRDHYDTAQLVAAWASDFARTRDRLLGDGPRQET